MDGRPIDHLQSQRSPTSLVTGDEHILPICHELCQLVLARRKPYKSRFLLTLLRHDVTEQTHTHKKERHSLTCVRARHLALKHF